MDSGSERGSGGLKARFLAAQAGEPRLELIEARPEAAPRGAPLLLIHGAFGGAWMWRDAFLPGAARRGRLAAAVSLRGHGDSDGRHLMAEATLADYASDVRRALAAFAEPPVVVAHSLGALLAQHLLGHAPMRALVMLAPLPPEGMMLAGLKLLLTEPELWLETAQAVNRSDFAVLDRARQVLFGDRFSPEETERYLSLAVAEGARVLLDAHVPRASVPAFLLGIPSLVVAGGDDRLISSGATLRTALYHGAEHVTVEGAGHLLNLEPGADATAALVLDWLERKAL